MSHFGIRGTPVISSGLGSYSGVARERSQPRASVGTSMSLCAFWPMSCLFSTPRIQTAAAAALYSTHIHMYTRAHTEENWNIILSPPPCRFRLLLAGLWRTTNISKESQGLKPNLFTFSILLPMLLPKPCPRNVSLRTGPPSPLVAAS